MTRTYLIAAALLAVAAAGSASAQAIKFTVDCSKGQTIGAALQRGDARKPLDVLVRGTCNEYVMIARDDVTLHGEGAEFSVVNGPGSAAPAIMIQGQRTFLDGLTVTGGAGGVIVSGPFVASLSNLVVRNPATGNAVVVRGGGDASITSCTMMKAVNGLGVARGGSARVLGNSEMRENSASGIRADLNSAVNVGGSTKILDNGAHGIQLETGSTAIVSNSEIARNANGVVVTASRASIGAGNQIHDNREHGVLAQVDATVTVTDNTIVNNNYNGVFGYSGSTLELRGNEIAFNGQSGVYCRAFCKMQIAGASIHDNAHHAVLVMFGSRSIFQPPMTTTGGNGWEDLWCGDSETSVDGVDGLSWDGADFFDGSVSPLCTGFND